MVKGRPFSLLKAASILFVFLLLSTCFGSGRKLRIPEKKLVDVLTDLHLANAVVTENYNLKLTYKLDSASLYGSVFSKHGITKAQFDSTLQYYSERPEDLQELYNQVTARLKRMEEETLAILEASKAAKTEVIWQDGQTYRFPPLKSDRIEINVPVKGPGLYTIFATVKFLPGDSTLNPRMNIFFYYDDNTPAGKQLHFEETRYDKSDELSRNYTASGKLVSPEFTHIKGFIIDYSNMDSLFKRRLTVSDIRITKESNGE